MKKFLSIVLLLIFLFSLTSCSVYSNKSYGTSDEYYYSSTDDAYHDSDVKLEDGGYTSVIGSSSSEEASNISSDGRKIILSSSFSIETKEFKKSCDILDGLLAKYGAYIESSEIYTGDSSKYRSHSARYTIRVPKENYNALIGETGSVGTVISRSDNNQDVTEKYYDIEARLTTLNTKRDRLLALLEKAEYIDDIISLNNALEETLYEIESLTGTLKKYDSLISYSTVTVSITEVTEISEVPSANASLGERISVAFKESCNAVAAFFQTLIVLIVAAVPVLIPLAVIALVIIVIIICVRKKRMRKKIEKD